MSRTERASRKTTWRSLVARPLLLISVCVTMGCGVGCVSSAPNRTSLPTSGGRDGPWRRAALSSDGKLIVFQVEYPAFYAEQSKPAVISYDYAILVDWDEDPARRHLLVFDRPRARLFATSEFPKFLAAIGDLPHGVEVAWVETCCAPLSFGLGEQRTAEIRAALSAGDRRLPPPKSGDSEALICTCESTRLRFPGEP